MSKLALPTVTLTCIDCNQAQRAIKAMEICKSHCDFGDVKLFTSAKPDYPHVEIPEITNLNEYSAFCMKKLHHHITTPHMLIVQWDGWIINPGAWRPHWLDYDYIGPLFLQEDQMIDEQTVGIGGFSLRSKALMAAVDTLLPPWDGSHSYDGKATGDFWAYEDGVISKHLRQPLKARGFVYAPPYEAAIFAQGGNPHPGYQCARPFGFHREFKNVDAANGYITPYVKGQA